MSEEFKNIDEYLALVPEEYKEVLVELREFIKECAPDATERISWEMPTFYQKGNLIHFFLHKNHIGLYPGSEAIEILKDELKGYKTSKGAVQLPLDKPLNKELIKKLIDYNLAYVNI